MGLYIKSTLNGCLVKSHLGDLLATLDYQLQPIARTKHFKVHAFECLSKIKFEDGKSISNEEFFGNSCSELIKKICLSQIKYFKEFDYPKETIISYNLPLSAICDDSFVSKIICEISGKMIALEITSFDIEKPTASLLIKIIENVQKLKNYGFKIWFDDFFHGNDQHCLWLRLLDWDLIKLDKSYLAVDDKFELIKEAFKMLRKLKLPMIVEGVEFNHQYGFLLNEDVLIQGFILSKAKPCNSFEQFKRNFI